MNRPFKWLFKDISSTIVNETSLKSKGPKITSRQSSSKLKSWNSLDNPLCRPGPLSYKSVTLRTRPKVSRRKHDGKPTCSRACSRRRSPRRPQYSFCVPPSGRGRRKPRPGALPHVCQARRARFLLLAACDVPTREEVLTALLAVFPENLWLGGEKWDVPHLEDYILTWGTWGYFWYWNTFKEEYPACFSCLVENWIALGCSVEFMWLQAWSLARDCFWFGMYW